MNIIENTKKLKTKDDLCLKHPSLNILESQGIWSSVLVTHHSDDMDDRDFPELY